MGFFISLNKDFALQQFRWNGLSSLSEAALLLKPGDNGLKPIVGLSLIRHSESMEFMYMLTHYSTVDSVDLVLLGLPVEFRPFSKPLK